MNRFDAQKYVALALSQDVGRGALEHMYRDHTRLVGSDGHRLHMIEYLPRIDKPHFLSHGYDGEYPNYEVAIPKDVDEVSIGRIFLDKKMHKRLKGMVAFSGEKNPIVKISRDSEMRLSIEFNTNTLPNHHAIMRLDVDDYKHKGHSFTMGMRLNYLIDAIIPDVWMNVSYWGCGLVFRGEGIDSYALVMQCALNV